MKYKIILDKQSRTNPSSEKKEYEIDIEELRTRRNVYDSIVITREEAYVLRKLALSDLQVLSELPEPVKEPLGNLKIELFEGDNYIYLIDMVGNKFYAEYLIKNEFTDLYVTLNEMNSAITQSAQQIDLSVNQKLEGYSTTQEMNSSINMKANEITSTVQSNYATKEALNTAKSEIKQTTDSITSTVSKKVGNDEIISKINQSAEQVGINANKIQLSANDILNLLAGNAINLTSKNIIISSDKFSVDKNGKVTCSDIHIAGGKINLDYIGGTDVLRVIENNNTEKMSYMTSNTMAINYNGGHVENYISSGGARIDVWVENGSGTYIKNTGIETPQITINGEGPAMYGMNTHKYRCNWTGSRLQFWVDETNIGTLSDKRLKTEIEDIDIDFINAIKEIEMKQFKIANRNGLISFGILAQDLIEIFKKYNKNPFDYEIVQETQYKTNDDTIYYTINYEQYLILKSKAQEKELEELKERIQKLEVLSNGKN